MPISSLKLRNTLQKPYDRILFSKEILSPVFNNGFSLSSSLIKANITPTQSESNVISDVFIFGQINLEDGTEITCYEVNLQKNVRIEYSKVAIQHYVRKLLTAGQAALINFVSPSNKNIWRLTLVAKDSVLTDEGIKERTTYSKRYTYLLGPSESCKTAAERFEFLSTQTRIDFESLVNAFSVEKLSKAFFDEYTRHYENFVDYLTKSSYKKVVFTGDEKAIRDFTKKLLGRIVFLYFVQKKGWLGATDTDYKDGNKNFIMDLFTQSGAGENFYPQWLTTLFFDTLNNSSRKDDVFEMPDGSKVKIPFLNGGLFDKEEYDEKLITFKSKLFHNHSNDEDPKERGFLDFLNAFNFTIYEDSPDEKTVAVDPEMLGHIFENLLEDNKDKGAFYTPKEIVHYMCQESLIEYLSIHLSKEFTVYRPIDSDQVEIFGNETRTGQLKIVEEIGDKALNRNDVSDMVKSKDIDKLTPEQIRLIDKLLDNVKICDPAIGSGAFPMGLLLEIFSIKELISYKLGKDWKPSEVKENIIQKSIYGVDIEKGAVDIARLRFWLSLVVDEDKPKPLPNLDYKIVVGDSLISKFDGEIVEIEWNRTKVGPSGEKYVNNIQSLLKEVTDKQRKYFDSSNNDKKKLSAEIRRLKIELLINQVTLNKLIYNYYNSEVSELGLGLSAKEKAKNLEIKLKIVDFDNLLKKLENLKRDPNSAFNHFDWKLDFPEVLNPYLVNGNGGFDILIGNPPYLNFKMYSSYDKEIYRKLYSEVFDGKADIYYYFFKRSVQNAKHNAIVSLITSRYWIEAEFAKKLRKYLSIKTKFKEIIDFKNVTIFDGLGIKTCITSLFNVDSGFNNFEYRYHPGKKIDYIDLSEFFSTTIPSSNIVGKDSWNLTNEKSSQVISIIEKESILLENIANCKQGIVTGLDKAFISVNNEFNYLPKFLIKPWLKVGDIHKYAIVLVEKRQLVYTNLIKNLNDYPELKKRLLPFKEKLLNRREAKNGKIRWFDLQWPREQSLFESEKLICRFKASENTFCYDNSAFYSSADTTVVSLKEEYKENISSKYILALLNSKVLSFYFKSYGKLMDYRYEYYPGPVGRLMIKLCEDQKPFITIVDFILFLKKIRQNESFVEPITLHFVHLIDGMVYELYFADLLKKHNKEIIKHLGELPGINDSMSEEKKLELIKKVYNRLNAKNHPVRVNLEKMKEIEEIKIIEGVK